MKKLIALGLMVCCVNVAFASDGSFTGAIDMTMSQENRIEVRRVGSELALQGRNENTNGGVVIQTDASNQPIQLRGRRD
ncbi:MULTISPECIES: hypothetical protein [Vibrio]|jgi:hypothetical protein|uniref:Uncharacterized protein n=1 Tax=Vibrio campbellii TaxID=680 RepID=A0AAE9SKX0_9VIBR|nr:MULTISPECIES: hypothetical protein [Vibrio]MED5505052.1 hypothetical protein [Pseudomonadota bacterium]ARV75082.1 hypothetical protein A8140_20895 [Vibrio campbellii CAIM 519 = NBRC 15631 = ATCC 25920]AXB33786.1 hypothetical protein DSB67_20500 [Vibrio campbellii]ELU50184.1 hypothetical protein B878_19430 [Vibrio campbellii CAIM 519 = NBRC 15631 = ATCC 25920]MDK9756220.1 hypothetical protein [Vibrio sp. D173a]|tara:strand:+ start:1136 stop:1372 length:237 start_codon:yes stop_codon:yes gene_type:complete